DSIVKSRRSRNDDRPTIHLPAQVRALVAPARQEIVDVLESAGPCSVAELAALVGRPADALYHHLRQLTRVGLIAEVDRCKHGRRVYTVYDLRIRPLRLSYAPPVRATDVARVVTASQRISGREFRRALESRSAQSTGPQRTLWGSRVKGWVSKEQLARINQLLAELNATVRAGHPATGTTPISVSFVLSPSPPSPRRRINRNSNHGDDHDAKQPSNVRRFVANRLRDGRRSFARR